MPVSKPFISVISVSFPYIFLLLHIENYNDLFFVSSLFILFVKRMGFEGKEAERRVWLIRLGKEGNV